MYDPVPTNHYRKTSNTTCIFLLKISIKVAVQIILRSKYFICFSRFEDRTLMGENKRKWQPTTKNIKLRFIYKEYAM